MLPGVDQRWRLLGGGFAMSTATSIEWTEVLCTSQLADRVAPGTALVTERDSRETQAPTLFDLIEEPA
jgi:hypothetical protein